MVGRAYGKTELALCYCPGLTSAAARRKLTQWIMSIPGLYEDLERMGYSRNIHILSPAMVTAIVELLGKPDGVN